LSKLFEEGRREEEKKIETIKQYKTTIQQKIKVVLC